MASGENAVQIPSSFAAPLAIDPHERFALCSGDEVIAGDIVAVPPAGLDALRAGEQLERPFVVRHCTDLRNSFRAVEQPKRAFAEVQMQLLGIQLAGEDCVFGAMLRPQDKSIYGIAAEPCAQPLDQVLPLARRLALLEPQPEVVTGERHHVVGSQRDFAHRLGKREIEEPLAQEQYEMLGVAGRRDQADRDFGRALSRCRRLRTKRCTPPERAVRNPASWMISRLAAKSSASAWVTSAGSESAAPNRAGGTKKFRGSESRPSARSSSARGPCPKRRAMPSRGSACSSPSVRTPIASNAASASLLQRRTSKGSAASTGSSSALSPINFCFPTKASQKAARGVGAPASAELQPISANPRRRRPRSDSRPPKSFRLPETSSSTPSGNSSATPGVNCAAHPATPSSASVSVAGSRGATRKAGARASAAVAAIP